MAGLMRTPEQRFWAKVDKVWEHWLWKRGRDGPGYGKLKVNGKSVGAHRYAYELLVGPVPAAMELDHLCRIRHCVNPDHLEVVTRKENILRGSSPSAVHARQTHCVHGHEFTEANTIHRVNGRGCRRCKRESAGWTDD